MNLARRLALRAASWIAQRLAPPSSPYVPTGVPIPQDPLALEYPLAFQLVPDVYACATLIAATIAELPLRFYNVSRNGNRSEIEPAMSGRLGRPNVAAVWASANPIDTGYELKEQIALSLLISGNAYLYDDPNLGELWMIPGHTCTPIPGPNRSVTGYEVEVGMGRKKVYPPERITHFKCYDPDFRGLGLSPLKAAQRAYETQFNAGRWLDTFFKKGAAVSAVYSTDQAIGPEELKRLQWQMNQVFGGVTNAFGSVILPRGLKYERAGLTQDEMNFIETQQLTSAQIFRIYKVPPVMLGVKEGGGLSDAGATTDQMLFWQQCIKPHCERISTTINERFLTPARVGVDNIECEFDFSGVLAFQAVWLDQAKAYVTAVGRPIMTANEGRDRLGLDELPDPTADELYLTPGPALPAESDAGAAGREPSASARTEDPRDRLRDRGRARIIANETRVAAGVRRLLRRQESRVVRRLRERWKSQPDHLQMTRAIDLNGLLEETNADRALIERLVRAIVRDTGQDALSELGLTLAFDLTARDVSEFISEKGLRLVTNVNRTTRSELQNTLAEGVEEQEGLDELVARVREVFNDRRANAATIARTETTAAYNFSLEAAWDQSGVVQGKAWLTAHDEKVRDSHRAAEEQGAIPLGTAFSLPSDDGNTYQLEFPGDPSGPAGEVINCRCTMVPEIVERAAVAREDYLWGAGRGQSFDDFLCNR